MVAGSMLRSLLPLLQVLVRLLVLLLLLRLQWLAVPAVAVSTAIATPASSNYVGVARDRIATMDAGLAPQQLAALSLPIIAAAAATSNIRHGNGDSVGVAVMNDGTVLHHISLGGKLCRAPWTQKRPLLVMNCSHVLWRWNQAKHIHSSMQGGSAQRKKKSGRQFMRQHKVTKRVNGAPRGGTTSWVIPEEARTIQ